MDNTLQVRLLGRLAFHSGGRELGCPSQKAMWLAAYVLSVGGRHERSRLASLLWGGAGQRLELGSLRVALTKLPPPVAACLEVTREAIAPASGADIDLDVNSFVAECAAEDVATLESATRRYAGELLQGVPVDAAPEFSDWLHAERTRLRELAHGAHLRLAQRLHAQGESHRARSVADAWLRHDPSSESMHRLLINWHSQSGGTDQALAQYEVYRRARAVAVGAPPSEEMAVLAERLRHGREPAWREQPNRLAAATSFVGRAEELAQLRGLLADPACRLLTLHGLGGVGKTRLASALADLESASFPGGVYIVVLDGLLDPSLFAQTLARACGLQPAAAADPLDLAASFLRDRTALLVLDNLEQLLGETSDATPSVPSQVARLLKATGPRMKVLATSREPMRLQEEWVFGLDGLDYPGPDATPADSQSLASVQFFAQRARQAYLGFSLPAELPNVMRICTLLEGLPLGLELAAGWVRSVPCSEIASGLAARAAELQSFHVNRADRHRSLGAVVSYSWERLPAEQREALEGLAALFGTFSREAAEQVARASVRTLSALTEKSLLQAAGNGRWRLHEVVRQFAWEQPGASAKARPVRQAAILRRRDAHFRAVLHEARVGLAGEQEPVALSSLELDAPNIRAAWHSFAQEGNVAALDEGAQAWFEYLECRCYFAEGIAAATLWLEAARRVQAPVSAERARSMLGIFSRFSADNDSALAALEEAVATMETREVPWDLARARTALAFTRLLVGELEDADCEASRALEVAEEVGSPALIASACRTMGLVALHSGRREEGRELQRRALVLALSTGKPSLIAAAHNNLALAENHLGQYAAAQAGYESALAHWRDLNATANIGRAMHNLGVVATRQGDHSTALERYRSALEVLRKSGDRNLISLNLMSTGDALVRLGRAGEAAPLLEQALAMAERDGHKLPALDARIVLAQAALAMDEPTVAAGHLAATFEGASKHHFNNVLADGLVTAARLVYSVKPEMRAEAIEWSACVAHCADISETVRRDALRFIEEASGSAEVRAEGRLAEQVAAARLAIEAIRMQSQAAPCIISGSVGA